MVRLINSPGNRVITSHTASGPARCTVPGVNANSAFARINVTRKIRTARGRRIYRYARKSPPSVIAIADAAPLKRIGRPDDMAGVAIYMTSRAGAYVTGDGLKTLDAVAPVVGPAATIEPSLAAFRKAGLA